MPLFKKNKIIENNRIDEFNNEFNNLLASSKYLARSDYKYLIDKYNDLYKQLINTKNTNTLKYYCKQNKIKELVVTNFLDVYEDISNLENGSKIINKHNEKFVNDKLESEKKYLDNILSDIDSNILLDEEQRKVILENEDYTLVIAGAGAGKTTTVAAKVKYLVEKEKVDPSKILVISFTNKAVNELKDRINDKLNIKCPITTFHSTGYAILRKNEDYTSRRICTDGFLFQIINDYIKTSVLKRPDLVDKLVLFFGNYFNAPCESNNIQDYLKYIAKADFTTLKGNLNEYVRNIYDRKSNKNITLNNEYVRSYQELEIANFLYLHGIDYEYEEVYPYKIFQARKPYTPDFTITQGNKKIYLEHFGISEDGKSNFYNEIELDKYKKQINDKILLHKKHNTNLIYTFASYNDGKDLLTHLDELLVKNTISYNDRDKAEVLTKIISNEENKYIYKFVNLVTSFISGFKTNNYNLQDFDRMKKSANVRSKLFIEICKECYLEYQKELLARNLFDFEDLLNESARLIQEKQIAKEKLDFKYIIVDEYQDISRQRYDLTSELSKICDAKIIAVGDDWQSIFAFSGSDISLFTHFKNLFGYANELKITNTYRNAQEVIDIAGGFIQKNKEQITKKLHSPKHIMPPVVVYSYAPYNDPVTNELVKENVAKARKLEEIIGHIMEKNRKEGKTNSTILLIGRYTFDAYRLCFTDDFVYNEDNGIVFSKKYPSAKIEFLTAHSSKGLGYDNVIIINSSNETYGFPSKIEDDPILNYVYKQDNSIAYAEERRLFYVALTRTKNRVFFLAPENKPSEFLKEIIEDYKDVKVVNNVNMDATSIINSKVCPCCGYPIRYRINKTYGLRLWMCTNDPEICNFISNDLAGDKLSIIKCDSCKDGYLLIKRGPENRIFLGCNYYKSDKTGCNRTLFTTQYEKYSLSLDNIDYDSLPSFSNENVLDIPSITPKKEIVRAKPAVNVTSNEENVIDEDSFNLIMDDENNVITDTELLSRLKDKKKELSSNITNDGLVSLATFKPHSKMEWLSLKGLGEVSYDSFAKIYFEELNRKVSDEIIEDNTDTLLSISMIAGIINTKVLDKYGKKHISGNKYAEWLEENGYLTKNEDGHRIPTSKGIELGISSEYRTNKGMEYLAILYNKNAQIFIYKNLAKIEEYYGNVSSSQKRFDFNLKIEKSARQKRKEEKIDARLERLDKYSNISKEYNIELYKIQTIFSLFKKGLNVSQIALSTLVKKEIIEKILKENLKEEDFEKNKELNARYINSYKIWSKEEENKLLELKNNGLSNNKIAIELKRSVDSIKKRLEKIK